MKTEKRRLGDIGESVTCEFLRRRGFLILERNYLRKWGEIDIVAHKGDVIHFVEVKSVSHVTPRASVTPETPKQAKSEHGYRPEENVHPAKLKRLGRTLQTYLLEKKLDLDWQLDVAVVQVDERGGKAHVEIIENVII